MKLFGINIERIPPAEEKSSAVVAPSNEDGATEITSTGSAFFGVYLDVEGAIKNETQAIQTYREIASYAEVDIAIQDIVDEAIPNEDDTNQVDVICDEDISDNIREMISDEFEVVLNKLNFGDTGSELFRQWYVDGRLYHQVLVDKNNPRRGILELRKIEATKMKKVREIKKGKSETGVDVIVDTEEYFVFNEAGFVSTTSASANTTSGISSGIKLSRDAVIYVPSGIYDVTGQTVQGYLHKAIRPVNQLRLMEDSLVVNRVARAPERRIFYVDVGTLPKGKAEQYMKDIMNQYRNKMVYDGVTGTVKNDKKYQSMLEDYWLPRRDNSKGTQIETLPGAQNLGQIDDINIFKSNMYQSLNVPLSRMQPETGFSLGRTTEISRDELKFQKFVDRLRKKFSQLFYDTLRTQLILKGICNDIEWNELREKIHFRFQRDNFFSELKNLDVLQARMAIMPQVDPYLGKYFSKQWVQKNILQFTKEQVEQMDQEIYDEKDDPMAKPSFAAGMDPGMGGDPSMGGMPMGGDPSGGGAAMPPDQGGDPSQMQGQPDQQYPLGR